MHVLIQRSVKRGEDIVAAGTSIEIPDDEALAHPEIYKPVAALEAERKRATEQPAEEAARKLREHMAQRDSLVAEEHAAAKARAALLSRQAEAAAKVAAEATRQAGLAPVPAPAPAPPAAPAAPPAEPAEQPAEIPEHVLRDVPPHKRGRRAE